MDKSIVSKSKPKSQESVSDLDDVSYEKEIKMYGTLYDKLTDGSFADNYMMMATRAFYNCMAMAARQSFGATSGRLNESGHLSDLAKKFMYLTGLNEEPDDMPWIISCIESHCIHTFSRLMNVRNKGTSEYELESELVNKFNSIHQFNKYSYVCRQFKLKSLDRIDVLCSEKDTDRPVIMELKKGDTSAHRQLRSYAVEFDNPVLINISEKMPRNLRDDILYFTFDDLYRRKRGEVTE